MLPNNNVYGGEPIGVVTSREHPGVQEIALTLENIAAIQKCVVEGRWREDVRAAMWVGKAVAQVMKLDAEKDQAIIKRCLTQLIEGDYLQTKRNKDDNYRDKMFVVVGDCASPSSS
jgi:hypothetical protein